MLTKYELKMPHAVFSGKDALERIVEILTENQVKHLAIFTDKGIEGAGLLELPMARVQKAGVAYTILDDLPAEPSYLEAQKLVDQCKAYGADFIMAVGGGSVQDTAKLASILMTDEYGVKELLDTGPGKEVRQNPDDSHYRGHRLRGNAQRHRGCAGKAAEGGHREHQHDCGLCDSGCGDDQKAPQEDCRRHGCGRLGPCRGVLDLQQGQPLQRHLFAAGAGHDPQQH